MKRENYWKIKQLIKSIDSCQEMIIKIRKMINHIESHNEIIDVVLRGQWGFVIDGQELQQEVLKSMEIIINAKLQKLLIEFEEIKE